MPVLRPYQCEALKALSQYFSERDDNPCVVLPTGSGKSLVIAEMIQRMMESNPNFRCIVLAHRQELVQQNYEEYCNLVGTNAGVGIYCRGLRRSDVDKPVVFAMINSVCKRASEFPPLDMIIVDEAHHIPIRTMECTENS